MLLSFLNLCFYNSKNQINQKLNFYLIKFFNILEEEEEKKATLKTNRNDATAHKVLDIYLLLICLF